METKLHILVGLLEQKKIILVIQRIYIFLEYVPKLQTGLLQIEMFME